MRCIVCFREGALRHETDMGIKWGPSCDEEDCASLAWQVMFGDLTKQNPDDAALLAWKFRRRRAEVSGSEFNEEAPMSEAEKKSAVHQIYFGDILRETS